MGILTILIQMHTRLRTRLRTQGHTTFTPEPRQRQVPRLSFVEPNLVAAVQKHSTVVQDAITRLSRRTVDITLFEQFKGL
mgnify:FL=1